MRIAIDAPTVRALSANEKMVYQFLKEGLKPKEIAKKLHIPLGSPDFLRLNCHDVMPDTVVNLITSIREKGWEIPTDKKEENQMANIKLSETDKRSIVTARLAGATVTQLAEQYIVSETTIRNVINGWKESGESAFSEDTEKEPVTAATDTSSDVENIDRVSTDIVPENAEKVKHIFSPMAAEAIYECICRKQDELCELDAKMKELYEMIAAIEDKISELDDRQIYAEAELDRLWEDYEVVRNGTDFIDC
ncbi:MAG: helix-turn-helix domain-containing protein [Oscillospiraceae bacterium]|nr:helix-turn-helix domain-containing protein [Oscillospiraceae bacterium]